MRKLMNPKIRGNVIEMNAEEDNIGNVSNSLMEVFCPRGLGDNPMACMNCSSRPCESRSQGN